MNDHGAIAGHTDCLQCQEDRDRAVIARIGGNQYRWRIATYPERARGARLDGYVKDDAESLAAGRSYVRGSYSQPYNSDTYHAPAIFHGPTMYASARPDSRALLPESAFDWPIYRAAMEVSR